MLYTGIDLHKRTAAAAVAVVVVEARPWRTVYPVLANVSQEETREARS